MLTGAQLVLQQQLDAPARCGQGVHQANHAPLLTAEPGPPHNGEVWDTTREWVGLPGSLLAPGIKLGEGGKDQACAGGCKEVAELQA